MNFKHVLFMSVLYVGALFSSYKPLIFGIISYTLLLAIKIASLTSLGLKFIIFGLWALMKCQNTDSPSIVAPD